MKGLIFIGCSFTWGQGLYFYSDLNNLPHQKELGECDMKLIHTSHIKHMESVRFARTVANHFKTFEVTKSRFCNGGCDDDSILFLDLIFDKTRTDWSDISNEKYNYSDIDYLVIQLTHPKRSYFEFELDGVSRKCFFDGGERYDVDRYEYLEKWLSLQNMNFDDFYEVHKKQLFDRLKTKLMDIESKGIKIIVLVWINDHLDNIFKDEWFSKKLLKLDYNNVLYNSIEDLMLENKLSIIEDFDNFDVPPNDGHPSLLCHNIIANNIINKIEELEKNKI